MDWLIDPHDPLSEEQTLSQLDDHLRRHVAADSGVDEALEAVREAVSGLPAPGDGALFRVRLDWRAERPRVVVGAVRDVDPIRSAGLRPGAAVPARHRALLDEVTEAELDEITLTLERRVQETFDDGPPPMVELEADPRVEGMSSVPVALVAAAQTHPTANPAQMASIAGAALADSITSSSGVPQHGAEVGALLVEAHRALGSDATLLTADDTIVELSVSRCPFGSGVASGEALCHVSTGLAGRLGARVNGSATVVLDETIAAGDDECHLQLWLDAPDQEVRGERHVWPPTVGNPDGPAPHLDLSLNLPSETASVPVVRRLAAQALRAFGVEDEDIDDVQMAISEACGNVIDHAGDTDTYEVKVELAADRCAITVVDQGGGFDATAVPLEAEVSSEDGRGLALMRALVDNVAFRSEPQAGAVVHMVKNLAYDSSHPLWVRTAGNGS